MEALFSPEALISLLTLTIMEVVLGVDNLVFVSIVSSRLPKEQQKKAQQIGLIVAMGLRIALLFGIGWLISLQEPVIFIPEPIHSLMQLHPGDGLSWNDIILVVGGIFLLYKATSEIHQKLEGHEEDMSTQKGKSAFNAVIAQITALNLIFSIDSILTAVGLVKSIPIMIIAVVISMAVMIAFVNPLSNFIQKHPTVKMLGLSFLLLIGFMLVAEGFHQHVPKGYIYFSIFFSIIVETLNIRMLKAKDKPVDLHDEYVDSSAKQQ